MRLSKRDLLYEARLSHKVEVFRRSEIEISLNIKYIDKINDISKEIKFLFVVKCIRNFTILYEN